MPEDADNRRLLPLDVRGLDGVSCLLEGMSRAAFGARSLGEAFEILKILVRDPGCTKIVTVSGAMSVAKMTPVLCEMIDLGLADIIVCTGAFVTHQLSEALGGFHIRHDQSIGDEQLYEQGYNRIYDTLEPDSNLIRVYDFIGGLLDEATSAGVICSAEVHKLAGKRLSELGAKSNLLGKAYLKNVPIYVPAFTDSEIGLALGVAKMRGHVAGKQDILQPFGLPPPFNPYLDLFDYTRRIFASKRLGIFTVGGGVPRNWAQQAPPFIEMINESTGWGLESPRFMYGIRICPEPEHWGGLSGCSYDEGISWGKFVPREKGGRFAEVLCDATIAWPLLVRGIIEYLVRTNTNGTGNTTISDRCEGNRT